jgi:low affinity Fe/Cu permease
VHSPAHWTTAIGTLTSHPAAFIIVLLYGVLWFTFESKTFDWHAVATLAVWTMTLFIQRADRRDTLAVHAKLDELLKVTREARTELAAVDEQEPEDIERVRDRERRDLENRRASLRILRNEENSFPESKD